MLTIIPNPTQSYALRRNATKRENVSMRFLGGIDILSEPNTKRKQKQSLSRLTAPALPKGEALNSFPISTSFNTSFEQRAVLRKKAPIKTN